MAGVISHSPGVPLITSSSAPPCHTGTLHFLSDNMGTDPEDPPPHPNSIFTYRCIIMVNGTHSSLLYLNSRADKNNNNPPAFFSVGMNKLPPSVTFTTRLLCLSFYMLCPRPEDGCILGSRRVLVTKACLSTVYPPSGQVGLLFALLRLVFTQRWEKNKPLGLSVCCSTPEHNCCQALGHYLLSVISF